MQEFKCRTLESAVALMTGALAWLATSPVDVERTFAVIEGSGDPTYPYVVWIGTWSMLSGKGERS